MLNISKSRCRRKALYINPTIEAPLNEPLNHIWKVQRRFNGSFRGASIVGSIYNAFRRDLLLDFSHDKPILVRSLKSDL